MKQGRKSRSLGKAAQVFVSLLLVLSMMGTSVFSVSAAGTEDENSQSESAVYSEESGDNVSEEDGSQASVSEEEGETDGDASISMPENDENTSTSEEDESETFPEDDQISLIDEEIPEEEKTEEDEEETEVDIETLAAGETGAFAVYSADDSSLTFYYGTIPAVGDQYNGKIVTDVYEGFGSEAYSTAGSGTNVYSNAPWSSERSNVKSVAFDESYAVVQPTILAGWFTGLKNCEEFTGLEYLDTSEVTLMNDMFRNCEAVSELDVSSFDTSKVQDFERMFYMCYSLKTLDVSTFDTSSATAINGMFREMTSVTEINVAGFDTSKAVTVNALFRDSTSLKTIYADEDWVINSSASGFNDQNMFSNCSSLVGGNGTTFDSGKVVSSMAKIDRDGTEGYFTNVRTIQAVNISGTKVWDDADNQDGIRPGSITVNLLANGESATDENDDPISMTVTAEDDWSFTFSGVPQYDDDFNEIEYTVEEEAVTGYECEITGDMENGFVITNVHTPEQITVSGTITWDDGNNQDGTRPDAVMVQVVGQDSAGGTYNSQTITVDAASAGDDANVWTWEITGLDQYRNGEELNYSVVYTEVDTTVYQQANDGYNVTYSYTPQTATISGNKTWIDSDDDADLRPNSITIRLHANGTDIADVEVTADDEWSWEFSDLPVYENGEEITYKITEDAIDDYDTEYDGFDVINTLAPGETSVTVLKDWEDSHDQDGKRPGSVTVRLLANGEQAYDHDGNEAVMTLSEENDWEGTFKQLDEYDSNQERITYTLQEMPTGVEGYTSVITGDMSQGFLVTNSYEPEKTNITGSKVWDDANNQDGIRPESVTVRLLDDNGKTVSTTSVSADENWAFSFVGVDKYAEGEEIDYTVDEIEPTGYEASVTYDEANGFTITNTHEPEMYEKITGTKVWDDDDNRDGIRPGSITVHLLANGDEVDTTALRPAANWLDSIISVFSDTIVQPDADGNWNFSFENLPKYANGEEITYTVTEEAVEGYTTVVTGDVEEGFTVTNTHEIETVSVSGSKTWDDEDNQDGKRPEEITIRLSADGYPVDSRTVTVENGWEWSFENLPKYEKGNEIVYTISEDEVTGYDTTNNGYLDYSVTNSYTPELFNGDGTFQVVLVWDDEANNDGIRPSSVTVTLTNDNTKVDEATLTLTADNTDDDGNWIGTFTGLPKYENGAEISYSVKEELRSGYTYRIEVLTDDEGKTYVQLTNVHVSVTEQVELTKIWDDADNQDGIRPAEITIGLLANGSLYKEVKLTAETEGVTVSDDGDTWSYTMKDIPVDKNGEPIVYTLQEGSISNYANVNIETTRGDEITDNGVTYQPYAFTITNTHTPEQVEIAGTKVWDDTSNQDGKRPQFVTLHLYANDVLIDSLDVTTEEHEVNDDDVWDFTFGEFDKYANGKEIEYTIIEDAVEGYETTIEGNVADGFVITNSYTPETTSITGTKTWEDDNDAQNLRPESITIRLHANGEVVDDIEVTADDNWSWTFTDLPVYQNGHEIHYTITEDAVDNYVASYDYGDDEEVDNVRNVTNTLHPGETSVSVEKDWEDEEDQDGIRPESITVELWADGVKTEDMLILSEENHWEGIFEEIIENAAGTKIVYTIEEVTVTDKNGSSESYKSEISGNATEGFDITNIHEPAQTEVSVVKDWNDEDDQDGIRPVTVTIHLLADDETVQSIHMTADDYWEYTFADLDKYASGKEIKYSIEEVYVAEGYEAQVSADEGEENSFTITNTHTPEQIEITGEKVWDDADNQDGIRPGEITVSLFADGNPVTNAAGEPVMVSLPAADGSWTYDFGEYDKYAAGEEIAYTVSEGTVNGYTASYDDFTITNTHTPEKFNGDGTLGVILRWDDEEDQDGIRPHSNTITLTIGGMETDVTLVLSDENVDEDGNWIGTFTDLDKYANGEEIIYGVSEGVMPGYSYTPELKFDEEQGIYYVEIIHVHEAVTEDITVTKVWDDANDQDAERPTNITLNLFSNGSAVKSATINAETEGVTVSDDGNIWTYTFENLPVDQNGKAIVYSLTENDIDEYTWEVTTDEEKETEDNGVTYTPYAFTVTNTHEPAQTEVSVSKVWEDENDQDGMRPHSIELELLIDGEPALGEDGKVITGTMIQDTENHWTYTFTGLDKYAEGRLINYGVEEFDVEGYEEISVTGNLFSGYVITNRHTPETTEISGDKEWEDSATLEYRPESIIINLYANGILKDSKTVTEADGWAWTFEDLDVYSGGEKITYVTTETAIENYDTSYNGFTLINTLDPGETSVTVVKNWDDANNQDGIRPASVTVHLLADGEQAYDHDGNEAVLTLTADNDWEGTFTKIDMYKDGAAINYTVEEDAVEGYTAAITGNASDGYIITNTHTPETVEVSAVKIWDDADDQDGVRPDDIFVTLYANGEPLYHEEIEPLEASPLRKFGAAITFGTLITAEDDWSFSFADLPKYADGKEIVYTIDEDAVDGYETVIDGDMDDGFEITNTHVPETTEVSGTKIWDDADDQDGKRPTSITVNLLADGEPAADANGDPITAEVTPHTDGRWIWSFTDIPKYRDGGTEIQYKFEEEKVDEYEASYSADGLTITNTYTPEVTSISGSKTWVDNEDEQKLRPNGITIRLHANGTEVDSWTVTAEDDWAWEFTDLPVYQNGHEIQYTITEDAVDNYIAEYDGYNVTNTLHEGETSVTVLKDWEDAEDQDGIRPESITVGLWADGVETDDTLTLSEDNNWEGAFEEIAANTDGTKIVYTIEEVSVDDKYETDITGDASEGFVVTNSYTPAVTEVPGSKTWDDSGDQDGIRPESITIYLLADGEAIYTENVAEDETENWHWTFEDLPMYQAGERIDYTIAEDPVAGYETEINGYNITNRHTPEAVTISGEKVWDDADNQDGLRPDNITVDLLADGETVDSQNVTAADGWSWEFTADQYADGKRIDYTINEEPVAEYDPEITGSEADGYVVTNTHEPEMIADDDHVLEVMIIWDDDDDADHLRPYSITLTLTADGEPVLIDGEPVTLVLSDENDWIGAFTGISLYRFYDGVEIQYSIDENEMGVYGYTYGQAELVLDEETGNYMLVVTNTRHDLTEDITVTKEWDDAENQDGKRPDEITVHLLANGDEIENGTVQLTAAMDWTYVFEDQPVVQDGELITYELTEDAVADYESEVETVRGNPISEGGVTYEPYSFTVTNTHVPETIDISGTIEWHDDDNKAGKRPESVTIFLYDGDGNLIATTTATAATGWSWSFTDLYKYENGKEIAYRVEEEQIAGYTEEVIYDEETGEYEIVDTYTGEEGTGEPGGTGGTGNTGGKVKTGDENNLTLWIVLLIAALAAVAGVIIVRRKR